MEWFKVTTEGFDVARRRAVFASFVLQATNYGDAGDVLDNHLTNPEECIPEIGQRKPKTYLEVFDMPAVYKKSVEALGTDDSAYYDKVPGNHVRLQEFKALEPSD